MNKKRLSPVNSEKKTKVTLTQYIESTEKQWIVSRGMKHNSPLIEGCFLSSSFNNGFSIDGSNIDELTNTTIVSTAPAALIITILLQGKLSFGYDNLTFDLDSSEQALGVAVNLTKPANFRRDLVQSNHVKKLHLMFTPEWIRTRLSTHCSMAHFTLQHKSNASFSITPSIFQMTSDIISSHSPNSFSESIKLEALSYRLFSEITEALLINVENKNDLTNYETLRLNNNAIDEPEEKTKKVNKTVENMVSYIESHLSQTLSLEKIAENFSMSASNLQRVFKQELGVTVNSYIRYRRLEIAKYHLEQGLISVTEAAYEAAYHHPANFTQAFKKAFGLPPTHFVKK